uniref:Cyclin-dependent kinase inhibitor domain-containing protein n=1 Tax=Eptatretus burgeri TaxID=7764 RepID=A0A8C4Q7Q1_EPTBU
MSLLSSPGDTTPQPVRRCLFGPLKDDPSSSQFECSNELQASIAEASRHWDFDFARNAPLSDGPERLFTWEAVPVHGVPSFYCERVPKDPRMRRKSKKEEQSSDLNALLSLSLNREMGGMGGREGTKTLRNWVGERREHKG